MDDQEKKNETNDDLENDVEIINKTIPEVIVHETSFDGSFINFPDPKTSSPVKETKINFEEEQLIDWTVVDDAADFQNEPKVSNNQNIETKPPKIEENVKEEEKKPSGEDVLLVHCAIRQSLSNETFVLQLDSSDMLDSYLDKTSGEGLDEKPINMKNECDAKENNSVNKTEKVCDALILTADDELETELGLEEKQGKRLKKDLEPVKTEEARPDPETKPVVPKTEPTESIKTQMEPNASLKANEKETEEKHPRSSKPRNVSRVLWVSNVTQSVRATDLKQYLTKIGKVVTAKIVTDGKKCYGYVIMDNSEDASRCLKTLNNAYFEGRKISLSFTRPSRTEKKEDPSKSLDADKVKSSNETDDVKIRDSKEKKVFKKRRSSESRSFSSNKRRSPNDPLTTKFDGKKRSRSRSRHTSRNNERRIRKYLREKEERERLQRRLLEEQRRNREDMIKQIQREEKHREIEFKLEQERRKLQLERELFEKERREITRLDVERRKIERERLEVLKQRSELQEELEKSRMKRKPEINKFTMSSVIGKPQESNNVYEKRKETLKRDDEYNRKPKHPIKEDSKGSSTVSRGAVTKSDRMDFKSNKDSKVMKGYDKTAPPPPKLTEFDRKPKHSDRKHEYLSDRKSERGARKIEVIERKYYPGRSSEVPERKQDRVYRKPEFDGRKPTFAERKYERYPGETYPERDTIQRTPWPAASSVNYNEPWKGMPSGPVSGSSTARYPEQNFSTSSYGGGGPSRITPFYYQPNPAPQEYPRYDHCSQGNGRKY